MNVTPMAASDAALNSWWAGAGDMLGTTVAGGRRRWLGDLRMMGQAPAGWKAVQMIT